MPPTNPSTEELVEYVGEVSGWPVSPEEAEVLRRVYEDHDPDVIFGDVIAELIDPLVRKWQEEKGR